MKRPCIMVDKTEIVIAVEGKKRWSSHNLTYDTINRIQFGTDYVRKLFRKVPVRSIRIFSSRLPQPATYLESKHKEYFEEYRRKLAEFARNNRISFQDEELSDSL